MSREKSTSKTTSKRFVRWATVSLVVSVIVGGLLPLLRIDDSVSIFNLWVDVVVGVFTIWGLMWAASEFAESAVKPSVEIRVGNPRNPPILGTSGVLSYPVLEKPPLQVTGWRKARVLGGPAKRVPNIACGLYLDNQESRAGRYVRAVIRVIATPKPTSCQFVHGPFPVAGHTVLGQPNAETGDFTLAIQFAEELVVYQSSVLVGELFLHWEDGLADEQLPKSVVLDYDTYTLDGASHGKVELCIAEWSY